MAETPPTETVKKVAKKKTAPRKKVSAPTFVTQEQFAKLESGVSDLVELIKSGALAKSAQLDTTSSSSTANSNSSVPMPLPPVKETPLDKDVRQAGPDRSIVNPEWEERAREIIGNAVDHCEMTYGVRGGIRFTVVIKDEYSNAPKDYLVRMGSDRRTKEIGGEGLEGVEGWCKLIKQNLSRTSGENPMRTD